MTFPPRPCRWCRSPRWAVNVVEVLASQKTGETCPFAIIICGDCGTALYGCHCASPEVDYDPDKGELQCENCGQRWALDLPAGAVELVQRAILHLAGAPTRLQLVRRMLDAIPDDDLA